MSLSRNVIALPAVSLQTPANNAAKSVTEVPMKISARNTLKGTIARITEGAVNSEVVISLPGGQEIVSVITRASAERLGLAVGQPAYAVMKASDVMVAVDH